MIKEATLNPNVEEEASDSLSQCSLLHHLDFSFLPQQVTFPSRRQTSLLRGQHLLTSRSDAAMVTGPSPPSVKQERQPEPTIRDA